MSQIQEITNHGLVDVPDDKSGNIRARIVNYLNATYGRRGPVSRPFLAFSGSEEASGVSFVYTLATSAVWHTFVVGTFTMPMPISFYPPNSEVLGLLGEAEAKIKEARVMLGGRDATTGAG